MNPRLIALSGSLRGTTFALHDHEVSIGRDAESAVRLNHPSVSRRHCLIKRVDNEFQIRDLDSYNGTFVNGIPVNARTLEHGDQVTLGDLLFLFLAQEGEAGTLPPVQMDEEGLITRSTIRLQREDAFYLSPERILSGLPPTARVARDLNALLKISATINALRDIRELQQRLLELILEVIPAEREAILLLEQDQELFTSVCGWNRVRGPDDSIRVSRTITTQVLSEGIALLSNDISENPRIGATPSLMASHVCSVLCVPLIVFEKPIGVIYLDTTDDATRFDEGHLQLLTAIAGLAAHAFENVRHYEYLQRDNRRLQEEILLEHNMVGESEPMRAVYRFIGKVAASESTVLLLGESGTGKELAARAIHLNSPRAAKPFVAINCATLSETLLESELFGHEKGAFTGAMAQKRGKLETADGGTVFLDEAGELTPLIQAKLLRVLQERSFERVGGTNAIKVDVRIIAATNKNLEEAIKTGDFRQDLYYRLNVVSLVMPPLRERREDISLLANYFTVKYSKHCKRRVTGISREARAALQSYDWPGNVRELENALERAVVLGSADLIGLEDLPENLIETAATTEQSRKYYDAIREAKKQVIRRALAESQGNYTEAAKLLGMHANNLHRLIRTLNLRETGKNSEK